MFSNEENLLLVEGNLTNTMLLEGLDCLRKANIYSKGLYYQAFYSLSVGIERLLKLIIIEEYRGKNEGKMPDNSYLKKLGHDIYKMTQLYVPELLKDEIKEKVIIFLGKFNKGTRYYNLDVLTGKNTEVLNPLEEWREIEELILLKYCKRSKKVQNKRELATMMDCNADIYLHDMKGNKINSFLDVITEFETRDERQGYGVLVCFEIIRALANKISVIEHEYHLYPYLWEIFMHIRGDFTKYEIRNKKNWRNLVG